MQTLSAANPLSQDSFQPTALRSRRAFQSRDVDFTRDRISQILQPHQLTPRTARHNGDFYTDHIGVGSIGVGAIHFGAMDVEVTELADYHLLLACLGGKARIVTDDWEQDIGANKAVIVPPGSYLRAAFSADCEQLFVRIPTAALRSHTSFKSLQFAREIDLDAESLAPFMAQIVQLCSLTATAALTSANAVVASEFERLLVCLLIAGQKHRDLSAPSAADIVPRAVRRAEAFIHAWACEPICLADISRAAEVPTRTLLDSFRRFRGTSPIQYLRDVRLENARTAFLTQEQPQISDVALSAGFTHLGRFAGAYAQRYGERPSETIRRR